ncbi:MAG: hypothetical protein ACN2B6_02140 [Rickettsiales bacterium]
MQTASLLHAVEHDFHAADHDEHNCGMYVFVDHTKHAPPVDANIATSLYFESDSATWQKGVVASFFANLLPPSRAPPTLS